MNDRMYESISALMDDRAEELELERILSRVRSEAEMRRTWMRFNLAQQAVHGHRLAHLDWDISERVQTALATSQSSDAGTERANLKQRLLRPLISLAVAASVTVTVVIGGQQLAESGRIDANGIDSIASRGSPVGLLNSLGATTVQASYGMKAAPLLQPATHTAYEELAQQRLRKYAQEHAEQAALNSPQGLVPFARVPQIRE